jgi:hypothetical protein
MNTPEADGVHWHTSSYTGANGNCVEVGWRTSSYTTANGNCVEVANTPPSIRVRDTKNRTGGTLTFAPAEWRAFLTRQL